MRFILKSKIHRARVTDSDLHYEGSITIDAALLEAAGICEFEEVHVFNVNNGERFITYAIKGKKNSGEIIVNGAAARLAQKGDILIILSYALLGDKELANFKPKIIHVDEKNKIVKK